MNTRDHIQQLPFDNSQPSPSEKQLVSKLFTDPVDGKSRFTDEIKDIVISAILFAVFNLPQVDALISSCVTNISPLMMVVIKAGIFAVVLYFVRNMYLIKKTV